MALFTVARCQNRLHAAVLRREVVRNSGKATTIAYTLVELATLHGIDPQVWRPYALERIRPQGQPNR